MQSTLSLYYRGSRLQGKPNLHKPHAMLELSSYIVPYRRMGYRAGKENESKIRGSK